MLGINLETGTFPFACPMFVKTLHVFFARKYMSNNTKQEHVGCQPLFLGIFSQCCFRCGPEMLTPKCRKELIPAYLLMFSSIKRIRQCCCAQCNLDQESLDFWVLHPGPLPTTRQLHLSTNHSVATSVEVLAPTRTHVKCCFCQCVPPSFTQTVFVSYSVSPLSVYHRFQSSRLQANLFH